jgi:hypothetical protein
VSLYSLAYPYIGGYSFFGYGIGGVNLVVWISFCIFVPMKSEEYIKGMLDEFIKVRDYHYERFRQTLCRETMSYHRGVIDELDIKIKLLKDVLN